MQSFNIVSHIVDGREVHELHLREESLVRNLIASGIDRICAATGHNLERTRTGSRALDYLLWLPAKTARQLAIIPVDTATARALSPDGDWFDEQRAITAEILPDATQTHAEQGDALNAGVV